MRALYIQAKNIGLIEDGKINFDKPLILLYGEIRQGKTTYLNAIRWVCGGEFPSDIIRHGQKEASIEFGFDGGMIRREFYVSKKEPFDTKAREVQFIKNGRPVDRPVSEIKRLLNPFLLNQDYLRNMGETDRKKYFSETFAVDTTALDTEAFNANREAAALRAKLTGYGDIDLTEAAPVDASALCKKREEVTAAAFQKRQALEAELERVNTEHQAANEKISQDNMEINRHNMKVSQKLEDSELYDRQIAAAENALATLRQNKAKVVAWVAENPKLELKPRPPAPDTTQIKQQILAVSNPDTAALDTQIQNAAAQNVKAEQYQKNKKRAEEKAADEQKLSALEKRQREIKTEKVKKLAGITETCGIKDLAFDEEGNFTYQGTQAGMLSTSQIMMLSSELSALYPEGLGVELLDRAESLGKSIFGFVDRAKADELTILATIVGEAPAKSPPEVGVFVVEAGKVKEQKLL